MPITLVPLAAAHAPALHEYFTAQDIALIAAHPNEFHYRAVLNGGVCVGMVGLKLVGDPEIVASTVVAEQQKGFGTEAVAEMIRHAFETVGLPAVYAKCQANSPSNKVVGRTGFTFVVQQGVDRFYALTSANWTAWLAAQQAAQVAAANAINEAEASAEEAPKDD